MEYKSEKNQGIKTLLIAGIPRAGKTSLTDCIERSDLGLTQVPSDRYILPVPVNSSFLMWVREPVCIDWKEIQ